MIPPKMIKPSQFAKDYEALNRSTHRGGPAELIALDEWRLTAELGDACFGDSVKFERLTKNEWCVEITANERTHEQEFLLRRHGAHQSVPQFVVLEPESPHLRDAA